MQRILIYYIRNMTIVIIRAMFENLPTQSNNEDIKSKCIAIVIYDTRFGNTGKVAEGLRNPEA